VLALRRIGRLAVHPDLFAINSQSILNTYLVALPRWQNDIIRHLRVAV
jgi:hypothetical protein